MIKVSKEFIKTKKYKLDTGEAFGKNPLEGLAIQEIVMDSQERMYVNLTWRDLGQLQVLYVPNKGLDIFHVTDKKYLRIEGEDDSDVEPKSLDPLCGKLLQIYCYMRDLK